MSKSKSFLVSSMYLKPRKPKATPKPPTTPPPPHLKEAGAACGRLGPGPSGATGETAGVAVYSNDFQVSNVQEAKEQKAWDDEKVSKGTWLR